MARKKVTLGWIAHDATRRATFKKRKHSLLKKVSELATLCGIDACAVVYGPEEEAPEVWPSPAETARVAARFRAVPESDQSRKKMDQEGFLRQRAAKLREQLSRQERDNRELEASLLMHGVLSGGGWRMCDVGIEQAAELMRLAEMKLVLVRNRIEREKAKTAVEPLRQAVEQVVGMAEPETEAEEDIETLNWLVEALNAGEIAPFADVGEQEVMALSCIDQEAGDPRMRLVENTAAAETEEEFETLNWLLEALNAGENAPSADVGQQENMALCCIDEEAEDPWMEIVENMAAEEAEEEVETLNSLTWLVEAVNAGENAPSADVGQQEDMALCCIDEEAVEPWMEFVENMAAEEAEEEVETLNSLTWLVEAVNAGENAPSADVGQQEDMALCCIDEEAVEPWMEFVEKMFGAVPSSCFEPESLELDYPSWQAPLVLFNHFDC